MRAIDDEILATFPRPPERVCTCRRPVRDRCYFGHWTCRLCGLFQDVGRAA